VSKTAPFYEIKLSLAGVTADSIRSLEDLDRLPLTTKADLRDHCPFDPLAVQRIALASPDLQEAMADYREKREPVFST
jgi:phenylacetate-coenzyme A ligase PaaK-like adenylate-forming protein